MSSGVLTGPAPTAVGMGQVFEFRAWFFGCWVLRQAVLGRHQVNVPHKAAWSAIQKGPKVRQEQTPGITSRRMSGQDFDC